MAQMKVSYSRRLDYQYMMIETDEEARSDYRLSMLINNRINGFLPVHVQQMNGKSTLSYEITSLENLPEFLDARKITYDEMVSLLLQFCSAVSEAGRYLLDGEGILLEPQYIYVSKSLERIRFCYYPYQHMPLHQSVNVLCRFLIDHIDYDDRRSLELAYGLFQESLRENLSISVIVGCIKDRLENATNDSCDSKVSSVQISSQIDKQITDQECKQSDSKQTDSGASEQEKQQKIQQQEKQYKNVQQVSDSPKREKTKCKQKKSSVTGIGILLIMVILGYVFFTAGKRLLLLDLINKNLLAAAGIFIVVAAVAAAFMAYWILKPKH
jgi:preprotein translocase subunit Sss1